MWFNRHGSIVAMLKYLLSAKLQQNAIIFSNASLIFTDQFSFIFFSTCLISYIVTVHFVTMHFSGLNKVHTRGGFWFCCSKSDTLIYTQFKHVFVCNITLGTLSDKANQNYVTYTVKWGLNVLTHFIIVDSFTWCIICKYKKLPWLFQIKESLTET